jgi:YhcH/YjgK/YiaL family protein
MIIDTLQNLARYNIRHAEKILAFISRNDCTTLPNEEIPIDGKDLYVRVQSYEPKNKDENKFETHIVHADVQYVSQGKELIQIANIADLTPTMEHDVEKDYRLYSLTKPTHCTDLVINTGDFALFLPGEAHRPSCRVGDEIVTVKKLVFKIRMK